MFLLLGSGSNGKSTLLEVIRELLGDYARQERLTRIRIAVPPGYPSDWSEDFDVIDSQTQILNIEGKTEDELWNGFHGGIRRNVRKARRFGVILDSTPGEQGVREFWLWYQDAVMGVSGS